MKHKFLLALICVCTSVVSVKAQIKKGSIWLGGSLGYGLTENDYTGTVPDAKSRTVSILPAVGLAVKDNLIVGVGLSYTNKKTENYVPTKLEKEKTYGGGLFIRKYIPVITKLYLFGEASAMYRQIKTNEEFSSSPFSKRTTKGWDGALAITPGLSLAVSQKLQLETGFNSLFSAVYSKRRSTTNIPADAITTKNFNTGIALDNESLFYVGVRFLINKG